MLVPERGNGSSDKSNSSGSGEKWADAGNSWEAAALSCVGRVVREREESRVPPAVLARSPLPRRTELPFSETRMTGQGREADLQGRLRGQLWT